MWEALKDSGFQKRVLWLNGILPALLLTLDLSIQNLGPNPPEAIIRTTGIVALIFLAMTLAVTPVAKTFKLGWLVRHKRWLGLWSFYYAVLHLLSYTVFDKEMNFSSIGQDISKRPFILLGFLGFLFLVPLAATSSDFMLKKLGAVRWKRLHKLTYVIAPIVTLHYRLIVKSDLFYPALFAFVFFVLLSFRFKSSIKF